MNMAPGLGSQAEVATLLTQAKDLHKRILFVLGAFIVYRLGTHVPLPGIDLVALSAYQNQLQTGLLGMFNMFSGGAFSRMAVFALNIFPFITASIIMQLMSHAYPSLGELRKEGEIGRRKIAQYTRYLTVLLAFGQGFGLAVGMEAQSVNMGAQTVSLVSDPGLLFRLQTALTIMTGTIFLMWVGERINVKGIGNGISLLIFAGIVAELPTGLAQAFELGRTGALSGFTLLALGAIAAVAIYFITFMETAQRRLLVQYPQRQVSAQQVRGAESNYLPLKINMAGVIPAIFASALMLAPLTVASFAPTSEVAQTIAALFTPGRAMYSVLFTGLIVFFCFFYTATVAFNSEEVSDNLKKQGGYIPGIRPGTQTAAFLDSVVVRLTTVGAIYLAFVTVVPDIFKAQMGVPFMFGGTGLLIIVSVTIDTVTRIQTALIAQRYESLLTKTALRGRTRASNNKSKKRK